MPSNEWNPDEDGITHINCYDAGNTVLGVMLSIFYNSFFDHPVHGEFNTLEGAWHYIKYQAVEKKEDELLAYETLRLLNGRKAQVVGRTLKEKFADRYSGYPDNFEKDISECIAFKIYSNKTICRLMKESELPFAFYHVEKRHSDVITERCPNEWFVALLENIRSYLKSYT